MTAAANRTKRAKDRARDIEAIISELRNTKPNLTLAEIAAALTERGILTASGKQVWTANNAYTLLQHIDGGNHDHK